MPVVVAIKRFVLLTKKDGIYQDIGLNCSQLVTLTDYVIWLLNIENQEMVKVKPSEDKMQRARFTVGPWSPDGKGFYVISTKNLRNGQVEEITNLSQNGVIEDLKLSTNGRRIGIMMTTSISPSDIYVVDIDKN